MAATLNVGFTDPSVPSGQAGTIQAAVQAAFAEWVRHFDYTAGSYTIQVTFTTSAYDVTLAGDTYVKVGSDGSTPVVETEFGLGFAARTAAAQGTQALTLKINPSYFQRLAGASLPVAPLEREFEHALGAVSFIEVNGARPGQPGGRTVYDGSVRGQFQFFRSPPSQPLTFFGPNAQVAYGGPVPLSNSDATFTNVGGGRAVNTSIQGAGTVQPLDVALLRDAGLPALTDQELAEHQVARLYVAAFGRTADGAGLVAQYAGLRGGQTLAQLGDGFVGSAEFTNRYGTLSDAGFVDALYRNVLGRAGDTAGAAFFQGALARGASRGTILAAFADSDEERGRLNGNPNVTYAATAEGQVARAYDTAFGRDADPAGYALFTSAIISGASLQQVAITFLGSAEFASRYGAAPSDRQLVDALYLNTLHRAADAAGAAGYVRALASGSYSRADLFADFSNSAEHIGLLAERTAARDAAGFNTDLTPHLGIIPVITGPLTA